MKITAMAEMPASIRLEMRSAGLDWSEMTSSLVAIESDVVRNGKPLVGYAFNSVGRYACGEAMRSRFFPRVMAADPASLLDETGDNFSAEKLLSTLSLREKAGGHAERSVAIGTIEVAMWDLIAKIEGKPLWAVLNDRFGGMDDRTRIPTYVGGGWYWPNDSLQRLKDELRQSLNLGYRMVKVKIGGIPLEQDIPRIEAALSVLEGGRQLAVDANGKFGRESSLAYADALKPYGLAWYEEPTDPGDYALMKEVAQRYPHPIGVGENLHSTQDAINLGLYAGLRPSLDYIQIDPPQCYGIGTLVRSVQAMERQGWSRKQFWPHGGNMMNLHMVIGLGLGGAEAFTNVFGPFGGFADDVRIEDGHLSLPQTPGIGFESQPALFKLFQQVLPSARRG